MMMSTPILSPIMPASPRRGRWGRFSRRVLVVVLLLAAAAFLLQTPPKPGIPLLQAQAVANIAHRGASGHAPENTLAAFALAVEMGAHMLEMDLHLTADGRVVILHDETVDRTTDGSGTVAGLTLAPVKGLDAGYHFAGAGGDYPYRGQGVTVPTLDEVFSAFPGMPLLLEMKGGTDALVEAVAAAIERYEAHARVLVASFDSRLLRAFRRRLPGVATSLGESEVRLFYILHRVGLHRWYRAPGELLQVPEYAGDLHVVTPRFLEAAADLGLEVHVWIVNEPSDIRRFIEMGVRGLISDYPDRVAAAMDSVPVTR